MADSEMVERQLREQKREVKKLREHLTKLTQSVMVGLEALDKIGAKKTMPNDLGKALAIVANHVEVANDSARYFGLGINFRTDTKLQALASNPPADERGHDAEHGTSSR